MGTWPHLDEFPGHLTPFSSDFESFSAMQWLNSIYRCIASTPTQGKFLEDIYGKTRNEFDDSHVSLVSISLLLKQTHPTATQWSCFGNILCNQYIFCPFGYFWDWEYLWTFDTDVLNRSHVRFCPSGFVAVVVLPMHHFRIKENDWKL